MLGDCFYFYEYFKACNDNSASISVQSKCDKMECSDTGLQFVCKATRDQIGTTKVGSFVIVTGALLKVLMSYLVNVMYYSNMHLLNHLETYRHV